MQMAGPGGDTVPELTNDLWRTLLAHPNLATTDILRVGFASKQLYVLSREEVLWHLLCQRWLDRDCARFRLARASARKLADACCSSSCRHLFQALHVLGGCPVGMWWLCDKVDGRHPGVELLSISVNGDLDCDAWGIPSDDGASSSSERPLRSTTLRGLVASGLSYEPIDNAELPERGRPLFSIELIPPAPPPPPAPVLAHTADADAASSVDAAAEGAAAVVQAAQASAAAASAASAPPVGSAGLSLKQRLRTWWSSSSSSSSAANNGGGSASEEPGMGFKAEGLLGASEAGNDVEGPSAANLWALRPTPLLFRLMDTFDVTMAVVTHGKRQPQPLRLSFEDDGRRMVLDVQVSDDVAGGTTQIKAFRLNYRRVEGMALDRPRSHGHFPPLPLDGGPGDPFQAAPPLVPEQAPLPPPVPTALQLVMAAAAAAHAVPAPVPPPVAHSPAAADASGASSSSAASAAAGPSSSAGTSGAGPSPAASTSPPSSLPLGGGGEGPASGLAGGAAGSPSHPLLPPAYLAAMSRFEGLWTAEYGSHGTELIQARLAPAGSAAPSGLREFFQDTPSQAAQASDSDSLAAAPTGGVQPPAGQSAWGESFLQGPRLEGFKLVGDVNVPSGQFTFQADLSGVMRGRHDAANLHTGELDSRPVLAFTDHGVQRVFLDRRPVAARLRGLGQINKEPGVWNPQWVRMELILYADGGCLDEDWFSVLWLDQDTVYRHIIDFQPYSPPALPSWMPPGTDGAAAVDANGAAVVFDEVD